MIDKSHILANIHKRIKTTFVMPDTVMREMRQLRQDKILDYNCPNKPDMIYYILKKPA